LALRLKEVASGMVHNQGFRKAPTGRVGLLAVCMASIVIALLSGCGGREAASEYAGLFPDAAAVDYVRSRSEITDYREAGLYEFLNGGAELYFDYGIVAAASAEYKTGPELGIEMSIYDMGTPEGAFGIYSTFRYAGADFVAIGGEGMKTEASLDFWKGRYYCKLLSFDTDPRAQTAIMDLGTALADKIAGGSDLPAIVKLLPSEGKVEGTEKYLRGQLGLNNIHYVDSENVLGLGDATEGAVAEYEFGPERVRGFMIRYPSEADARQAFDTYVEHLATGGAARTEPEAARVELGTGKWVFAAHDSNYIIGVWDAVEEEADYAFITNALASIRSVTQ
jgi:hypothetical protein